MKINKPLLSSLMITAAFALSGCSEESVDKKESQSSANGHGHDHAPHEGVMVPFTAGQVQAGFAELKLHDDKGDLELWLTKDSAGKEPFDMPLGSIITVAFPELNYKIVNLKIRNTEKNEDEDGNGNIRDGKTNYFIFPGDTGEDAKFLMGKEFKSAAIISFDGGGKSFSSKSFKLYPHTH